MSEHPKYNQFAKTRPESYEDFGDETALAEALREVRRLLSGFDAEEQQDGGYEVFKSEYAREELFRIGKGIAEYVDNNDIGTVCFIDRSARPAYVALSEYWNKAFPDKQKPDIRFINPKGCVSREDVEEGRADQSKLMMNDLFKQGETEDLDNMRSESEIVDELKGIIADSEQKDRPMLLFDACIHSGDSIRPTADKLLLAGVKDVRIGTVSNYGMDTDIPLDLKILNDMPDRVCYPFGRDKMTRKIYGSVTSEPNPDKSASRNSSLLREEIKKVMDDEWEKRQDAVA